MGAFRHLRVSLSVLTAALLLSASALAADVVGNTGADGTRTTGMGGDELNRLGDRVPGAPGLPVEYAGPWYQFGTTGMCSTVPPGQPGADNGCGNDPCIRNADVNAKGPAVRVWQRQVDASNQPLPDATWENIGFTCLPALVPGNANALTMAMIVQQFHDTAFAVPTASVQPVKGRTLVNLPTYYELVWPEAGFGPQEVDTTTLVGRTVDIRPVFKAANYSYGDGQESGPTASLGGPYPTGDVVHKYSSALPSAQVRIDVTYRGEFRINGGPWIEIPGEVTIQGTPFPLEVAEARAQLVR